MQAPEACQGVGIKLLCKLQEVLDCEKGMGGRTVQKYVENPLLAPYNGKSSKIPRFIKFDLRVWVLVTSFSPLKAFIFSNIYGRCCCVPYDDDISTLSDNLIHLTNYSIQKNSSVSNAATENNSTNSNSNKSSSSSSTSGSSVRSSVIGGSGLNAINKLRQDVSADNSGSSCSGSSQVPSSNGRPLLSKSELLLSHSEVISIVNNHFCYTQSSKKSTSPCSVATSVSPTSVWRGFKQAADGATDGVNAWVDFVWPSVKAKVAQTLVAACCSGNITHREKSFQFLGFDVLIDDTLNPWVLEVNMSPALARRDSKHNATIEAMSRGLVELAILPHFNEQTKEAATGSMPTPHSTLRPGSSQAECQVGAKEQDGDGDDDSNGADIACDQSTTSEDEWAHNDASTRQQILEGGGAGVWEVLTITDPSSQYDHTRDEYNGYVPFTGMGPSSSSLSSSSSVSSTSAISVNSSSILNNSANVNCGNGNVSASNFLSLNSSASRPTSRVSSRGSNRPLSAGRIRPVQVQQAAALGASGNSRLLDWEDNYNTAQHALNRTDTTAMPLAVIGKSVSSVYVRFTDMLFTTISKSRLLQDWARRYLVRLRRYHHIRKEAATTLQANIRVFYNLTIIQFSIH